MSSPAVADRWLAGLRRKFDRILAGPSICPVAAENDKFAEEIREMLRGERHNKYRIVFTIRDDTVVVLYERHGARDESGP